MAVVACLLAIPAAASPPPGGSVLPQRHIMVVHNIDLVAAFGYPSGETLRLEVRRGGIPIARVVAPVYAAEVGFGLEVNHGPEGPVRPGDCFEPVTPDVRPGDLVEAATASDPTSKSRALIDDILIDDVAEDGDGLDSEDVLVTGTARFANGAEIPGEALDSGAWRIGTARGAGPLVATDGNGHFTARYEAPNYKGAGVTSKDAVINQATHEMGYGRVEPPLPREIQLVDGVGEANGPFGVPGEPGSCPGRASDQNDITVADDPVVNLDSGALNLSGPADNTTSGVMVTLEDADGTSVTAPFVHLEQGAAGKAWDAQFTRQQLATLDDGTLTATATFAGSGAQATRPVPKDTLAPAPPTATPDSGSYVGEQFVTLNAEPGATIRFTIGAAEPITGETFGEAIRVSSDATIRAIAIDAAGNESGDVEFEYDIQPPAQGAGGGGAAGGAAGGETGRGGAPTDQGAGTVDASTLRVTGLRTRSRIRLAGARRRGVLVSFVAPPGASVAQVELFRLGGAAQRARPVGAVTVVLNRAGRHSVRLASRRMRRGLRPRQYRIVVRVGTSRNELGRGAATRVRIVR